MTKSGYTTGMKKNTLITVSVSISFFIMSVLSAHAESGITFGPYVQRVTQQSATVLLRTDAEEQLTLHYRQIGKKWRRRTDSTDTTIHRHRIGGAARASYEYYFSRGADRITQTYTVTTQQQVSKKDPLRIAVFGDSGGFTTDQLRVATQIQFWKPDLMLHTGDMAYNSGTYDEFVTTVFKPYQPLFAEVPMYGSIGNHDYTTEQAGPYKEVWELPTTNSGTEDYYSFDNDIVHMVSLNTNLDFTEGSAMYAWLQQDLEQSKAPWKIVFFHHPVFSSALHGSTAGMAESLAPLFSAHGVQLVLNGHDHNYERNQEVDGVRYIVTGGGGKSLYEQANENPYSEFFLSEYHFVGLIVTPQEINLKAIDKRGYIFDTVKIRR